MISQEDIESLGWKIKFTSSFSDYKSFQNEDSYKLDFNLTPQFPIRILDKSVYLNNTLFKGKLENKEELITIMKQTGIL